MWNGEKPTLGGGNVACSGRETIGGGQQGLDHDTGAWAAEWASWLRECMGRGPHY